VEPGLAIAVVLAFVFAFTNGFHDESNSIATLVATRAARPGPALALAVAFVFIGPLVLGSAVAATIAGLVDVPAGEMTEVVTAALVAALLWNLATWYLGLPSSSGHALVGGLVGAGIAEAGLDAVNWGGFDGWRPTGVIGVLVGLAISPLLGAAGALVVLRVLRSALRRGTQRFATPVLRAQWVTSALLAASRGANDGQKAIGLVAAVLLANGSTSSLDAPAWATFGVAATLACGTALGGWRIVRTVGRRIFELRPLDGLASSTASAGVILGASFAGLPLAGSQVVASSVVGVGGGRRRWGRVRWVVVRELGIAWLTTIPATALLAAAALGAWRWLS
jgi:PiT family inorganic phosphate transporter